MATTTIVHCEQNNVIKLFFTAAVSIQLHLKQNIYKLLYTKENNQTPLNHLLLLSSVLSRLNNNQAFIDTSAKMPYQKIIN